MVMISVLTPTYNRCKTLKRLYESLLQQNNYDFEWIVIDDGSNDSTNEYMESVLSCSKFNIIYRKIENSGKHKALNIGIEFTDSILSICVDSDDWLTDSAIETIISTYKKKFIGQNKLIGIIAKRGYVSDCKIKDLTIITTKVEQMTLYNFYFNNKCSGDTALIYDTKILKNNKFTEYGGEKFISENSLYFQLDKYGNMLLLDEIIYLNEYQKDGLTANYKKLLRKNPNGTAFMYYIYSTSTTKKIERIKYLSLASYYIKSTKTKCQIDNAIRKEIGIIPTCLGFLVSKIKERKD